MTVDEIKNILNMVAIIMDLIAKYFPVDLNKQLIDLLSTPQAQEHPAFKEFFAAQASQSVDFTGAIKVLKGLDALYKDSPDIADFATRMKNRNLILKLVAMIV